MSPAEKYGRGTPAIPAEALSQAHGAGQTLAQSGTVVQPLLGSVGPSASPAVKYGGGAPSRQVELPPMTRSR